MNRRRPAPCPYPEGLICVGTPRTVRPVMAEDFSFLIRPQAKRLRVPLRYLIEAHPQVVN